jgi:hypothetical protein
MTSTAAVSKQDNGRGEVSISFDLLTATQAKRRMTAEDHRSLSSRIGEAKKRVDGSASNVMWDAALDVYNAVEVSDLIGEHEGAAYRTRGVLATELGFSEGYVSRLLKIGRAVVRHGVRRNSKAFAFLAANAANKALTPVLGDTPATTEEFNAALEALMSGKQVESGQTRQAQPNDGTESEGTEGSKPTAPATAGDIIAQTQVLEVALHGLDDVQAEKVRAYWVKAALADKQARDQIAAKSKDKDETPTPAKVAEHVARKVGSMGQAAKDAGQPKA